MYTIRIDNLEDYEGSEDLGDVIARDLNAVLAEKKIKVDGVGPMPGRNDLFVLYGVYSTEAKIRPGQRSKDKLLSFQDWIAVNNAVNDVMDKHGFFAIVKSSKFIVRIGRRRRDNYEGGRSF